MRMTEKGQVTIPRALRRRFGLQPNVDVEFIADKDGVRIKKRGGRNNPFHGLRGAAKHRFAVDQFIETTRGR